MDKAYRAHPNVLIVLGVLLLIHSCSWALILIYVKRRHPETWTQLGSPMLFTSSVRNQWYWFLIHRKYTSLNDPTLNWLGNLTLLSLATFAAVVFYSFFHAKGSP